MDNMEEICEMRWKLWKKSKSNSEKIWKIQKQIVKWYGNYEWKVSWIVNWFEQYGSWIVERYGKYGIKASWIVKWYGKYERKL
jgi:hypothetical protein